MPRPLSNQPPTTAEMEMETVPEDGMEMGTISEDAMENGSDWTGRLLMELDGLVYSWELHSCSAMAGLGRYYITAKILRGTRLHPLYPNGSPTFANINTALILAIAAARKERK